MGDITPKPALQCRPRDGVSFSRSESRTSYCDIECARLGTPRFQGDYQRERSGRDGKKLDVLLMQVVNLLATNTPLAQRNFDHPLLGEWSDHRDCQIRPDLVLIYRKPDNHSLELVRRGSHSALGL
jgi:mRNA interferase YafQ